VNEWYFVNGNTTIDVNGFYSSSGNGYPGSRAHSYKIIVYVTAINYPPVAIYTPVLATRENTPYTFILQGFDVDITLVLLSITKSLL